MPTMQRCWYELVGATRSLWRRPGMLVAGVASLSIGIAASTVLIGIINATRLSSLPYPDPERIALIAQGQKTCLPRCIDLLGPNIISLVRRVPSLERIGLARPSSINATFGDSVQNLTTATVDAEFVRVLGARPAIGRLPEAAEYEGAPTVGLISYRLWEREFGHDRSVVGQRLRMDGTTIDVIGVMPQAFDFPERTDIWLPNRIAESQTDSAPSLVVVARLRASATLASTAAELTTAGFAAMRQIPLRSVLPLPMNWIRKERARDVWLMLAVVIATLAIASANLVSLSLARLLSRKFEFALRSALGASTADLSARLILEGALVGAVTGSIAIVIANVGQSVAPAFATYAYGYSMTPILSIGVLSIGFGVSILLGVLIHAAVAYWVRRSDASDVLRTGSSTTSRASNRARGLLIATQMCVVVVLASGAAILAMVATNIRRYDVGYDADHLLVAKLSPIRGLDQAGFAAEVEAVVSRVQGLPGVEGVAIEVPGFPRSQKGANDLLRVEGVDAPVAFADLPPIDYRVGRDFFRTTGIPVVQGRAFRATDDASSPPVAIINRRAQQLWFKGSNAIGRTLLFRDNGVVTASTIVGVVANTAAIGSEGVFGQVYNREEFPFLFRPLPQTRPSPRGSAAILFTKTSGPPTTIVDAARRALSSPAQLRASDIGTLRDASSSFAALQEASILGRTLTLLTGVAVLLALCGTISLVIDSLRRRRREIGIRLALGAPVRDILRVVCAETMSYATMGGVVGVGLSLWSIRYFADLIPRVGPDHSFIVLCLSATTAIALAAASCLLMGLSARGFDPLDALRVD